jgi:hypothetical protein
MGAARRLVVGEAPQELARRDVVAHVERAVLADDRVDGPHPRDVVAPSSRPAGDRDDEPPGGAQTLHRRIGLRGKPAVRRQRVVDVGEHPAYRAPHVVRHRGERPHHAHVAATALAT